MMMDADTPITLNPLRIARQPDINGDDFASPPKSPNNLNSYRRSPSPPRTRSPRASSPPPGPCQPPAREESGSRVLFQNRTMTEKSSPMDASKLTPTDAVTTLTPSSSSSSSSSPPRQNDNPPVDPAEEESLALARMLMEQEAMESYAMSADFLQVHASNYSEEDFQALQAALAEDEENDGYDEAGARNGDEDMSYDMMLRLGECIGDVKQERWAMEAKRHIAKLPTFKFDPEKTKGLDENDSRCKCLVCQFPYEPKEELRKLPCGHCFHVSCVDHWLSAKDACPYCRQPIV